MVHNVFSFPPSQSHALPSRGILKSNALELVKNQRSVNEQNARVVSVNLLWSRNENISCDYVSRNTRKKRVEEKIYKLVVVT